MKALAFLFITFATVLYSFADSLERFSPCLSPNTEIIWQAPTNELPAEFWVYRRLPPQPFPVSVISNAVRLASLQIQPTPSTKPYYIWSDPNPCGMSHNISSIQPASATISFSLPRQKHLSGNIPDDQTIIQKAHEYATQFGLTRTQLVSNNVYIITNSDGCDGILTNSSCARGILLSRKLDGVSFYGNGNDGSEGFSVEFGGNGQIRSFSFAWPNLDPVQKHTTASPNEIIGCIRAQKVFCLPEGEETNYFKRIENLATNKSFTITKITPYFSEGIFGETPTNDEPPKVIAPIAELEAIGDSNSCKVSFLTPILSFAVYRLLNGAKTLAHFSN